MALSYLALGDSYTIGELVPIYDSFPYQSVQLLRNQYQLDFVAPEIVAKTGWTTDELSAAIQQTTFLPAYDVVSLLIGVNNQYRGRSLDNYVAEFEALLQKAIKFSGHQTHHVFVLSIPDWGATPFAADKESNAIAAELDAYNAACKHVTESYHCQHIDITPSQRQDAQDPAFLASDLLHPSGKEYAKWAQKLANRIQQTLGKTV